MTLSATSNPMPGDTVTVTTDVDGSVKLYLSAVPSESSLTVGALLDASGASVDHFVADVAGSFNLTGYEYRRTYPNGVPFDKLVSTSTLTVKVGKTMGIAIRTLAGHGATLRLVCPGLHTAPVTASLVSPLTEISRLAILDSSVIAALAAMVNDADSVGPSIVTAVNTLRTKFEAHRVNLGSGTPVHYASDVTNAARREPAVSVQSAIDLLGDLYDQIRGHTISLTSGPVHHGTDDTTRTPLMGKPSTLEQAIPCYADIAWRVFQRHIGMTAGIHGAADSTNTLGTSDQMSAAIVAFLDAVALRTLTAPANEGQAAVDAASHYGARPVD